MNKKCSKCKKEKELKEFGKCKVNKDGRAYMCRECYNEESRAREKEKRDTNNEFLNYFI